jgi:D-glycero-alpha-D-manno-heptose-7-phosphate kinase
VIVTKCPVRISLVGGSSDLELFLDKNKKGSVISIPCSLNTYISVHENNRNKYIINYSLSEEVNSVSEIKNDVARVVLEYFDPKSFLTISFNSDIFSVGSGLASSSSYMVAMIKCMCVYTGTQMSDFDICKLALELERKFNPLTGQQDTYGCGMMDFKRINFFKGKDPSFTYLPSSFLNNFDIYLLYTGETRRSTNVLKSIDVNKIKGVLDNVDCMHDAILKNNTALFTEVLSEGWKIKKSSSQLILSNSRLQEMDNVISSQEGVLAHKLCGAGGGGHFVLFTERNARLNFLSNFKKWAYKVSLTSDGLRSKVI